MKKRLLPFFIVLFLIAAQTPVFAQQMNNSNKFDKSRYSIKYEKFVLDNGLTLLVHEDKSVPIVGVNMWYHIGSRNEKRGKTGFAHLFEHFFFNGSENFLSGFREAMDDISANNWNGTTNTDRTSFFECGENGGQKNLSDRQTRQSPRFSVRPPAKRGGLGKLKFGL